MYVLTSPLLISCMIKISCTAGGLVQYSKAQPHIFDHSTCSQRIKEYLCRQEKKILNFVILWRQHFKTSFICILTFAFHFRIQWKSRREITTTPCMTKLMPSFLPKNANFSILKLMQTQNMFFYCLLFTKANLKER